MFKKIAEQIIEVLLYCPIWLTALLFIATMACYYTGWQAVTLNTPGYWSRFGWVLLAALILAAITRIWAWLQRK